MQIKTKLTEVDLIKANFVLLTRKLSTKLYLGILLFVFIYTGVIPAVNGKSVYILSSVAPLVIVVVFI
jgi:hypothetical protein